MSTTDLVPSVSIAHLVNARAGVAERLRQAFALVQEAADIAAAGHVGMPRVTISRDFGRHAGSYDVAAARIKTDSSGRTWDTERCPARELERQMRLGIDCAGWQYLMHESGLRSLMDAKARDTWDKAIGDGDVPELTEANIRSTFRMLHDSRAEMFERGVIACFKSLSWDYKTNMPQKFGKRIVLRFIRGQVTSSRGSSGTLLGTANYHGCNTLDDLSRVLSVLDGKPEPDHRIGWYGRINRVDRVTDPAAEDDYIRVRSFRNGNGHATFKRPDLVDQMNRIIAKHYPNALPEPKP